MVEVRTEVSASPQQIFAVLADGWSYASWVVGASHIREVDSSWPQVGAQIHHRVGPCPLTIDDTTTVRAVDPPHSLELDAGLWPFGAAWIRLDLIEIAPGRTEIRMAEQAVRGPGRWLPGPAEGVLLAPRNKEALARLADIAVGKKQPSARS
ncbi:SRPBCC family protein [Nocardia cyriacigeorgica]|uniref:SRPBCC family protein n=1 Tax=Nocardia cyriacigeorgica (strain GUH-2) TaxID=1127134 RepID=H6RCD4_NOCCG|nr:SRPBCC family protein [Nocardia cyriacigeorgica]CCF63874.1 conserved protein of unknown function [Nocardia cyriacigeorgica GUH-2]